MLMLYIMVKGTSTLHVKVVVIFFKIVKYEILMVTGPIKVQKLVLPLFLVP